MNYYIIKCSLRCDIVCNIFSLSGRAVPVIRLYPPHRWTPNMPHFQRRSVDFAAGRNRTKPWRCGAVEGGAEQRNSGTTTIVALVVARA